MNCPLCGSEMQEGGLIVHGPTPPCWVPLAQFTKKGLRSLAYSEAKPFGKWNILLDRTTVPNAFYCENCNKITGIFDVTNHSEE